MLRFRAANRWHNCCLLSEGVEMVDGLTENYDNLTGGLYVLLIGDALGVPYEFYNIPDRWRLALRGTADVDILWKRALAGKMGVIT